MTRVALSIAAALVLPLSGWSASGALGQTFADPVPYCRAVGDASRRPHGKDRAMLRAFLSILATLVAGATAGAADPSAGFIGSPLAETAKSDFFTWFHLEKTDETAGAAGSHVLDFRPSAPRFHQLTAVEITVDSSGVVRRMDLVLRRAFIDNPGDAPFARDIAKSFLRAAPPALASEQLKTLADEVEYRISSSERILVGPGYRKPPLPDIPSAGYETYQGTRPSYQQTLDHCALTMTNTRGEDGGVLRIELIAK
jgi:hypothetical protein